MIENSFKKRTTNVMSRRAVDDVSAAGWAFGKNYDYEMSCKMHSNIQYLCGKCGTGNSLAKCTDLLTIAGCTLYFDILNFWHSWHFTDIFYPKFLTYWTKNITQSFKYTWSWESCAFVTYNSYHFCISKVGPSEKNCGS